jgi:hypothetical protein
MQKWRQFSAPIDGVCDCLLPGTPGDTIGLRACKVGAESQQQLQLTNTCNGTGRCGFQQLHVARCAMLWSFLEELVVTCWRHHVCYNVCACVLSRYDDHMRVTASTFCSCLLPSHCWNCSSSAACGQHSALARSSNASE